MNKLAIRSGIQAHTEFFDDMFELLEQGIEQDADGVYPLDAIAEAPYSVVVTKTVRVLLAAGGPNIYLVAELGQRGEVTEVRVEGDWGTTEVVEKVRRGSPMWKAAEFFAEREVELG